MSRITDMDGFNQPDSDLNHKPFPTKEAAVVWLESLGPSKFIFYAVLGYWQTKDGYIDAKPRYRDGTGYWWEFVA